MVAAAATAVRIKIQIQIKIKKILSTFLIRIFITTQLLLQVGQLILI